MSLRQPGLRLEDLGTLVTLKEYCRLYREGEWKVRHQVRSGTCRVPPAMTRPLRWRRADLEADVNGSTAAADRKRYAKQQQQSAVSR
jgi:hypothetical protein